MFLKFFLIGHKFQVLGKLKIITLTDMATEISQSKTICILAVVAGCFAILWPSLFYPMLKGSFAPQTHTGEFIIY